MCLLLVIRKKKKMKKKIKFEIDLDENHLPKKISIDSSDSSAKRNNIKALFVSAWRVKKKGDTSY